MLSARRRPRQALRAYIGACTASFPPTRQKIKMHSLKTAEFAYLSAAQGATAASAAALTFALRSSLVSRPPRSASWARARSARPRCCKRAQRHLDKLKTAPHNRELVPCLPAATASRWRRDGAGVPAGDQASLPLLAWSDASSCKSRSRSTASHCVSVEMPQRRTTLASSACGVRITS